MFQLRPRRTVLAPRAIAQLVIPVLAFAVFGGLLWREVAEMDLRAIGAAIAQVSALQWALAGVATWFSFGALGRYDGIWHEIMNTGVPQPAARRAGMRAVAIAQLVGFGAITASLVRWRCLPGLSLWKATHLSLAVTLAFTVCWLPLAVAALWWIGDDGLPVAVSLAGLTIGAIGLVSLAIWACRRFVPAMTGAHVASLLLWTAMDMACAALAFYVLLPAGTEIRFDLILAAYVIALGLGLLSSSPGGTGAFDLTLLALVPLGTPEPLVATIVAFRLVYYVIPAMLALVAIARPATAAKLLPDSPAHWGLVAQTGEIWQIGSQSFFVGDAPVICSAIGPIPGLTASDVTAFGRAAHRRMRVPALYNCDPRSALMAAKAGWHVRRIAMDAVIRPATWTTAGGKRQTLRRKLRQAEQAGVRVRLTKVPDTEAMRSISAIWARTHGGEYGFSMGRFSPSLIGTQRVFHITCGDQPIGFVTFHANDREWVLDLVRHRPALPDGAIHAAIVTAIEHARAAGIEAVSLAAVPDPRYTPPFWAERRAGLTQFKRSFAPAWVGRYHAAPNRVAFWMTGAIIAWVVHRPLANLRWRLAGPLKQISKTRLVRRFRFAVRRQT